MHDELSCKRLILEPACLNARLKAVRTMNLLSCFISCHYVKWEISTVLVGTSSWLHMIGLLKIGW
jgi:hypothetical protein